MTLLKTSLTTLSLATLLALAGCGGSDASSSESTGSTSSESPSEEPTEEPSEEPSEEPTEEAGAAGATPEWALPAAAAGDLITTIDLEGQASVEVYQAGTTKAAETGSFVDPDTNKPLVEKGDTLVVLDYVVTNTGSEPLLLSSLLVDVTARYADWPYLQGMDGVADQAVYEEFGVHESGLDSANYVEPPYELKPGESFSTATNFEYEQGGAITFEASLVPSDEQGELLTDQAITVEEEAETP